MRIVEQFPFTVVEYPDWRLTMSDGCELSVRLWMPANAESEPVPAIIEHLPYRKRDGTIARDQLTHPWFAGNGYACLRVDMRGNGDSDGIMEDEYTQQELQDACEVISWAARQRWCSGSVGMMGISWGGFNSLQVAALRPPALKAIITLCSTVDRFADDIHYKGGCMLTENLAWAATMFSYSSRPPDKALVGERWSDLWLQRLQDMPFLATPWMSHQTRDDYWKHGSVCEDYTSIDAAVLTIGGWHDGYRNTISHLVSNLTGPVKGIVGPWIHKYPHYAAPAPAIGFLQEAKRWWDHWLKGIDTGVDNDPAYTVWLMDSIAPQRWLPDRPGRWIAEKTWPSTTISEQTLYVSHDAIAGAQLLDKATTVTLSLTVNTPQHCGQSSGEYFPFNFGPELPDEQSADDELSLLIDGEVLSDTMDIVGAPVARFRLASSTAKALICVRLCEIRSDGSSALITSGMLNLTHHESSDSPSLLQPGKQITVDVTLDQIAFRVPAGHRLRMSVSNTYWPFLWPSPESGCLTISAGELRVPVRRNGAVEEDVSFESPESATPWAVEVLRKPSSSRDVYRDVPTGLITTEIINDFGENRDAEHGLVSGSIMHERWSIHPDDPLSATAQITWQQNGGRNEWQWSTDVDVALSCDADYFYIHATLVAQQGDTLVFAKDYDDRIERLYI